MTVAELVGKMKGASSHFASQVLGATFKWQGAYAAFSVSRNALPRARAYVLNQKAHHRDGTAHPALEPADVPLRS